MSTFLFSVEEFNRYLTSQMKIKYPEILYEPMYYATVSGGKRMRANLVMAGCQIVGKTKEEVYPLALAIELLHAFSLVHDDIMDNSDMRRGKPSVMKKYGTSHAILSGDALLIKAYQYLSQTDITFLSKTLKSFTNAAIEICEGQAVDITLEHEKVIDKGLYLKMIGKKTAVLFATALSIGGIATGCTQATEETLYKIGYDMGIAFQIQDDWFDSFGTEEVGKTLYTDILNCKNNYLYVTTCEQLKGEALANFTALYAQKNGGEEKINQIKKMYSQLNIEDTVSKEIQQYYQQCYHHIEILQQIYPQTTQELQPIIDKLMDRKK